MPLAAAVPRRRLKALCLYASTPMPLWSLPLQSLPLCLFVTLPLCLFASLIFASLPLCLFVTLPLCLFASLPLALCLVCARSGCVLQHTPGARSSRIHSNAARTGSAAAAAAAAAPAPTAMAEPAPPSLFFHVVRLCTRLACVPRCEHYVKKELHASFLVGKPIINNKYNDPQLAITFGTA